MDKKWTKNGKFKFDGDCNKYCYFKACDRLMKKLNYLIIYIK